MVVKQLQKHVSKQKILKYRKYIFCCILPAKTEWQYDTITIQCTLFSVVHFVPVVQNLDINLQTWSYHTCPLGVLSDFPDSVDHLTVLVILLLCVNIIFSLCMLFSCLRVQTICVTLLASAFTLLVMSFLPPDLHPDHWPVNNLVACLQCVSIKVLQTTAILPLTEILLNFSLWNCAYILSQ